MATNTIYQKSRKAYTCSKCKKRITKGSTYSRFATNRFAKEVKLCMNCQPTRSQMTSSDFLQQMYAIEDNIQGFSFETLSDDISNAVSEIESLRDQCQEKLDNMPEQLQESSSAGQTLQSRVESCEDMISELEGIDIEFDDEIEEEVPEKGLKGQALQDRLDEIEQNKEEREQEIEDEMERILEEVKGVSYNGE